MKYKATIIEDITSGTLVKTKIIEAKNKAEAQECVEQEGFGNYGKKQKRRLKDEKT